MKVFWQRFLFFQAELMRQNQVARSLLVWCTQPDNEASFCLYTQRGDRLFAFIICHSLFVPLVSAPRGQMPVSWGDNSV